MLLKQPLNIGNLTVHNRLVLPPMASKTSGEHGYVSDDMIAYYEDICRGGFIGLVVTEHAYIHINGKADVRGGGRCDRRAEAFGGYHSRLRQ